MSLISIEDHNVVVKKLEDEVSSMRAKVVSLGQTLQACLNLQVKGQPCMITSECADGVYWQDAIMDCIEQNTGMKYDREVVYLSQLPESQYIKALKKLEKDRAAKGELS